MFATKLAHIQSVLEEYNISSKVWVYYSEKNFSEYEVEIEKRLTQFTNHWKSHGSEVKSQGFTLGGHIILLVADTTVCDVSGCSTDSSVQFIQSLGDSFELDFFDRQLILLLIDKNILPTHLKELKNYKPNTLVFNPFFKNLQEWKNSFLQTLDESKFKRFII